MPCDDPHCHWTTLKNGTTVVTYSGALGTWETVGLACDGLNLFVPNLLLISVATLISVLCVTLAFINGSKRSWTPYNRCMLLGPVLLTIGNLIEIWSVSNWYQWNGSPNWAHLPKVFWYADVILMSFVQGFRIEFILIATNRPRIWSGRFVAFIVTITTILGLLAIAIFLIGCHSLPSAPISFSYPYSIGLLLVGLLDVVLSVTILTLCGSTERGLRTLASLEFDVSSSVSVVGSTKTGASSRTERMARDVVEFVRDNRAPALLQLLGDGAFAGCYLLGALSDGGYTFSLVSTLGIPVQNLFLLYSIESMRRAQQGWMRGIGTLDYPQSADVKAGDVGEGGGAAVKTLIVASAGIGRKQP
ncbi:hypothetical protein HKX48_007000 [Thoreauomyces humboldtii]|nr:hypothetical protein HKX48_007000 [Thoreauomyces humboldtii]